MMCCRCTLELAGRLLCRRFFDIVVSHKTRRSILRSEIVYSFHKGSLLGRRCSMSGYSTQYIARHSPDWNFVSGIPWGLLRPEAEKFRMSHTRAKGRAARHFLFEHDERRLERMNDGERARGRHDAPVREATPIAKDHHVARTGIDHFHGAIEDKSEIALLAAV